MTDKIKIKEIFASIQGEGPLIGYKQLFIRFCGCNLNCNYCDTDFGLDEATEYSVGDLEKILQENSDCHSVSLTGGEPLLHYEFLNKFLPEVKKPIYLETNATLYKNLEKIVKYVDFISADIKLPSCTGLQPQWNNHDEFFRIASLKQLFAKIVFDNRITDEEIEKSLELAKKYDIELILQPKMNGDILGVEKEFIEKMLDKFLEKHTKTRVIPQVHKFLNVR